MRVAFVAPYFYPFTGGVETASWETATALVQEHGVEVEVHTSWHTGPGATMPPGPTAYFGGGLTVHRYRSPKQVVFFMPKISESCDVVHVLGFHRLLVPAALCSARKHIGVLQPYGNVSQVPGEPSGAVRSLRLAADKTASKWFVSKFSVVLCLDERERQAMVRSGAQVQRTRLLRAPVPLCSSDKTTSDAGISRDGGLFLCVARVTRLKYVEHAIMALAHAPRARLVVVGPLVDESYHRALVSLSRDIGVDGRVSFFGQLPAAELHARYREAAGLVLCSRNEGQGLVLAEAAARGSVPIVARGASDELIAAMGCGLSYPWGDPVGLAQCLEQVMEHRASFEAALANARMFAETELAPSVVAAKLLGIYGELGAGP
jgi:glycosyltransferase involved in cell wall biosynthesis